MIALSGLAPDPRAEAEALIQEARRRRRRRNLLACLAVVVLAGVAGAMVSHFGPSGRSRGPAFLTARGDGPARYSSAPGYYAYTVRGDIYNYTSGLTQYSMGVPGRYLKVRATATGKLLATISPPGPDNDFGPLTADASGHTFVFAARRIWERNAGPSPRLAGRDLRTPVRFLVAHITPAGHLQRAVLSLPEPVTPVQLPSIALSPDGTRLAVAFGGRGHTAAVQVITLATGHARQWVVPHSPWTPVLGGEGAWTANGRTLAFEQESIPPPRVLRLLPAPGITRVRLLDTAAPGTSLAASKLLVLRPPAGESAPARPFLTPDGTRLIAPAGTLGRQSRNGSWHGELAVYSARTGALLSPVAPWAWRWPSPPGRGGNPDQTVAWSDRTGSQLIILQPRGDLNILAAVAGNTVTQAGAKVLPLQPSGYQELQYALRIAPQMAW